MITTTNTPRSKVLFGGVALLLILATALAVAQDGFIDGKRSSGPRTPVGEVTKTNPFMGISNFGLRLLLCLLFIGLSLGVSMLIVGSALDREGDLLAHFFWANCIFTVGIVMSLFVFFGDYSYDGNPRTIGEHFSKLPWYIYALVLLGVVVLIGFGYKGSSREAD
jgi:hypothetical protein